MYFENEIPYFVKTFPKFRDRFQAGYTLQLFW